MCDSIVWVKWSGNKSKRYDTLPFVLCSKEIDVTSSNKYTNYSNSLLSRWLPCCHADSRFEEFNERSEAFWSTCPLCWCTIKGGEIFTENESFQDVIAQASLVFNQKKMPGHTISCLTQDSFLPFPAVAKKTNLSVILSECQQLLSGPKNTQLAST